MQKEGGLSRGDDKVLMYMASQREGTGRAAHSHDQLIHAQLAATVTLANKLLGSARNQSEMETKVTKDGVGRSLVWNDMGARLPFC